MKAEGKSGRQDLGADGRGIREYTQIAFCILSACLNGALKSHVADHCNLNSRQLDRYAALLLNRGLLEYAEGRTGSRLEWRTTAKGRKYVEVYYSLDSTLNERRRAGARKVQRDHSFWTDAARALSDVSASVW